MKINQKVIGEGRTYIIAELSGNHNQDFGIAAKTVLAVASTGADAIKLQTYTADTLTLNVKDQGFMTDSDGPWAGQSLYSLYQKAYTPWEWHRPLQKIAHDHGLDFFSSPFDTSSVDFLARLDVPAYKIASFEITDIPLIEYMASKGKPVIISTGIADENDIKLALDACERSGNVDVILLKCTSEYPASIGEANLRSISLLRERFGVPVGISDHTLGTIVPLVAVTLGAAVIEKHVILDRALGGVDSSFSLSIEEFAQMVREIRSAEQALGIGSLSRTAKMEKARCSSRSLYVVKGVVKGQLIEPCNLRSIRPGFGLHPRHYAELLGKRYAADATIGTPMSWLLVDGSQGDI